MNKSICEAIRKKAVIKFHYQGRPRIVQPQSHGMSTAGKEVLRGYQTSGASRSGHSQAEKLFEVSKISGLKETGEVFLKPGPHFNPDDKAMELVHCCLQQDKVSS